ncbi:uncharacterized protein LOC112053338 [Bicyclus anynana]|uniref:Uncharacterized protein LOC112053338 n=1 Tax=Bicyclus anynana TaxID=110368 RepID=A0A6J1NYI2_BICAN|nr:uncharacterized protein LOC112053338 [Bicyclus anynana]XP_052743858.1 uncharacterized protein LOC112053338 [Bicyclus anynana]
MAALLLLQLLGAATAASLGDLARRDTGDVFTVLGGECGSQCVEYGAGAAGEGVGEGLREGVKGHCACACPQRAPLFREDRELCVDDLPECSLATFGSGTGVQRIPFVYLPLKGQIIHPSREITFHNVKTPICAVSGAQYLTRKGFLDLRNTIDADVPFSLFRDEGRTFLQWSGEDEVRKRMSGRVMVVRLLCRDISATPISPLDLRGVFTPCVAFRVQGTPPRHATNITEVQFASNAQTSETSSASGLTVTEYIAIGISSLLLGLIYVASVFLYLHIKKRRKASAEDNTLRKLKVLRKKDGTAITEHDIIRINNERVQSLANALGQDDGVVKKNPLLNVVRQFHDNKSFTSDLSDCEDFADNTSRGEENNETTSVIIHKHINEMRHQGDGLELNHRDESSIERLPDEHVSIVETIDDREIARPVGTTRRKLYFNPAYFEPHLMADPPAAAIEFLSKIREVIAIAKQKMAIKRFHPILNHIPEEETYPSNVSVDLYHSMGSQRSGSMVSLKRENSRKRSTNCLGCPGCKTNNTDNDVPTFMKYNIATCSSCLGEKGDKQHSIRKWLENIPSGKQQVFYNDNQTQNLAISLLSLPNNEKQCQIQKQNSFSATHTAKVTDEFAISKRNASRSVRSEPSVRNYNLPLPEFNDTEPEKTHCQTVSRMDDITPIDFNGYISGSLRQKLDGTIRNGNTLLKNNNALPDMVNEAIALDHFSRSSYNLSSSDEERCLKNSTPDEAKTPYIKNNSDVASGHEYETDSLERTSNKKGKSIDYPDVPSSQASPSLSNALPLEEELTMRNAVYKTNSSGVSNTPSPEDMYVDDNHYEIIEIKKTKVEPVIGIGSKHNSSYSLVSEVYVNNNYNFGSAPTSPSGSECSMGSRKGLKLDKLQERPGCLTIEVKDPPENYIKIHESDGFEPDTLDRKHPKHKEIIENINFSRRDLLKNIDTTENRKLDRIQLRSSGTYSKNNGKSESLNKFNSLRNDHEHQRNFLNRPKLSPNIYSGSKSLENTTDDNWDDNGGWTSEDSRILTLELRHSKRQRQCTPPTIKQIKNLARPDILPPLPPIEDDAIYEKPRVPPRRVQCDNTVEDHSSSNVSPRNSIRESLNSPPVIAAQSTHPQKLGYEDINIANSSQSDIKSDDCRNSTRTKSCCSSGINTNTFVRSQKGDNFHRTKFRRKRGTNIEDSGYLSSDSTSSKQFQKKIVIAKVASCTESEDTGDEARSESGAESIETHSVYFGNCHKLHQNNEIIKNTVKVPKDSRRKVKIKSENHSQ